MEKAWINQWFHNKSCLLWWPVSLSIRIQTTLNHIRFVLAKLQNTPPLICISLNKNSIYCYIPRSSKHTDTCNGSTGVFCNRSFVLYHNVKDNEEIFVLRFVDNWKHRLRLESARAALCKWATCTRQLSFQNFCKLAQHAEAIRKHCLGKE